MKKLLFASLMLMQALAYGQHKEVTIIKETDDMTGEVSIMPSRKIVLLNSTKTVGFSVLGFISKDMQLQHIAVMAAGLGACIDKSEIILLLEGDNRIVKRAWSKFNCEGNAYFSLADSDIDLLSKYALVKIRVTNGQTHSQYTSEVPAADAHYFIDIIKLIDNN